MNNFLRNKVIHPFLFAAFPVLFLYAENFNLVSGGQVLAPLGIIILLTALLSLLTKLLFQNRHKAGIFASVLIFLFFLYQPIYNFLQAASHTHNIIIYRHRELIPIFSGLILTAVLIIKKNAKSLINLNYTINIIAFILLFPSSIKIGWHLLQNFSPAKTTEITLQKNKAISTPDIYYIVVDSYARKDILQALFKFDNTPFLKEIKKRGFYLASKSRSNYWQTRLSIASALNLNYIQNLQDYPQAKEKNTNIFGHLIANNNLFKLLSKINYQTVAFSSGYDCTELTKADFYIKPESWYHLNNFNAAIANTTPLLDLFRFIFQNDLLYDLHREKLLAPFNKIPQVTTLRTPKFVFIHSMILHPPFVFTSNGDPIKPNRPLSLSDGNIYLEKGGSEQEYLFSYPQQITFLNKKLLSLIDTILTKSPQKPIIIIQGDHSARIHLNYENINTTNLPEAFSVLNAYYFPNNDTTGLYPSISPVNTFRLISNKYFNTDLTLLPDKNYYSTWSTPLNFTDVTDRINSKKQNKSRIKSE